MCTRPPWGWLWLQSYYEPMNLSYTFRSSRVFHWMRDNLLIKTKIDDVAGSQTRVIFKFTMKRAPRHRSHCGNIIHDPWVSLKVHKLRAVWYEPQSRKSCRCSSSRPWFCSVCWVWVSFDGCGVLGYTRWLEGSSYDTLEHRRFGEPIWVSTRSSHCRGPLRCSSIQQGVLVTVCRLQEGESGSVMCFRAAF